MSLNQPFISELEQEAITTRKMLERVPEDKLSWKPHEKSMTLGRLAVHVAELPNWATAIIDADELDFAKMDYKPRTAKSSSELLQILEENLSKAITSLKNASDEHLLAKWRLRNGEQIFFELPRVVVLRSTAFNHLYHHRGQLSVFLRLLDVPLPGVYGPTADEQQM
jgi:uncharacterized damage-inducible protein DinB